MFMTRCDIYIGLIPSESSPPYHLKCKQNILKAVAISTQLLYGIIVWDITTPKLIQLAIQCTFYLGCKLSQICFSIEDIFGHLTTVFYNTIYQRTRFLTQFNVFPGGLCCENRHFQHKRLSEWLTHSKQINFLSCVNIASNQSPTYYTLAGDIRFEKGNKWLKLTYCIYTYKVGF